MKIGLMKQVRKAGIKGFDKLRMLIEQTRQKHQIGGPL